MTTSLTDDNKFKNYLEIIGLLSFVLVSAFVVLRFEYESGSFLFSFFKSKVYYANFDKIIFPVYFWLSASCFLVFTNVLNKNPFTAKKVLHFLSRAFFFHLYLILLTHSVELTPGFSLIPTHLPTLPYSVFYAKAFIYAYFCGYYFYAIHIIKQKNLSYEWFIPLSFIVPILFGYSPTTHLICASSAFAIFILEKKFAAYIFPNSDSKNYSFHILCGLFFLALGFRLWYASYLTWMDGVGFSADGPYYFQAAKDIASANFSKVDYWHAPIYSLYLSFFIKLFGSSASSIFYSQAVIGAFLPILIVKIVNKLSDIKTAHIVGFLVAVFPLCIHYSVVLNRASLQILVFAILIYFCLTLKENNRPVTCFAFGALLGTGFYLGQETLPVLMFLAIYGLFTVLNTKKLGFEFAKSFGWAILGAIISFAPLNGIFYSHSEKLLPLGRDPSHIQLHGELVDSWTYGGSQYSIQLNKMGFNPLSSPLTSLDQLISDPLKIIPLYGGRFLDELSGFLFDTGSIFIAPLNLEIESFYGANIQFYFYLFIGVGLARFLTSNAIDRIQKSLILLPIILQAAVISSFLFGTLRYRAPIAPLYLILAGLGIRSFIFNDLIKSRVSNSIKASLFFGVYAFGILSLFLASLNFEKDKTKILDSHYKLDPWINLVDNRLKTVNFVTLNETVLSFYQKTSDVEPIGSHVSFNICRFLMGEEQPYYLLLLDGEIQGTPKKIPHGCSEIKEPFNPSYEVGIMSLFVYFSPNGETPAPQNVRVNLSDTHKSLTIPIIKLPQNSEGQKYKTLFDNYSWGFVKISEPIISSVNKN
jgi:hypothetical protein